MKFVVLGPKTYSYLADDISKSKKVKDTKICVINRKIKFKEYKNCLEVNQL